MRNRTRQLSTVLLFLILWAAMPSGVSVNAGESTPTAQPWPVVTEEIRPAEYCPDSQELAFLDLINALRESEGLKPLKLSRTLGAAAEYHSRDMAKNDYFSHDLSDGRTWSENIVDHGYVATTPIGENIAAGYSSAEEVFSQWAASSTHRENMLSKEFTAIGIARAHSADSTFEWYWTTTFGGEEDEAPSC